MFGTSVRDSLAFHIAHVVSVALIAECPSAGDDHEVRTVSSPFDTTEVADLLGVVQAGHRLLGTEGCVWPLTDGRVLKLTTSPDEAAVCLAMREASCGHASLPRIDAVHWVPFGGRFSRDLVLYAVLREDMPEVAVPPDLKGAWEADFDLFQQGWNRDDPVRLERGLASWEPHGPELRELRDALRWMQASLGITLRDLAIDNVGRCPGRGVAPRDFGVADLPSALLDRVARLDFDVLPGLAHTPGGMSARG